MAITANKQNIHTVCLYFFLETTTICTIKGNNRRNIKHLEISENTRKLMDKTKVQTTLILYLQTMIGVEQPKKAPPPHLGSKLLNLELDL